MLAALAVVAFGLVALVLLTPVDLALRCERRPVFRYRLGFRWLFGLVGTEVDSSRPKEEDAKSKKRQKSKKKEKRRRRHHVGAMLMTKGFLPGVVRLLERLVHAVRIRIPSLWLRAGLDDPADTGLLCAWMLPLSTYWAAVGEGRFDVAPDFTGETFQFAMASDVRLVPARLLWPVVVFGLSPSTFRALLALRRGRI
jgi:hypothetical protein